ncbi:MAG: AsmA-like C-terminal region-containing protein [Bacteroidota bacterium]
MVYWKQDDIVQHILTQFNEDFVGEIEFADSHISPFETFPHITIDLEHLKIWEGKDKHDIRPIIEVEDAYLGFDFWTILSGKFDIDFIRVENGEFDIIRHCDGKYNVLTALSSTHPIEEEEMEDDFHLHLKSVQLKNLDIHQFDEIEVVDVETYVHDATASFKSAEDHVLAELESNFELNVIDHYDTTFIRHKHFFIDAHMDFDKGTQLLTIDESQLNLEHGEFTMEGSIDAADSMNIDLQVHGNKPNFDLLIAFAPTELIPTLERYENAGEIFFEADVKGKPIGRLPLFKVDFGCKKAWVRNSDTDSRVNDLEFQGQLTNGLNASRGISAMQFILKDFNASPKAGFIQADIDVKNFDSPDIDMKLRSSFDLTFLKDFLNLETVRNLNGKVVLDIRFHDIIDLDQPEKAISKLNEAYFTQLTVEDLSFSADGFDLPIKKVNAKMHMEGHEADIDYLDLEIGGSDLHIDGLISDLPAVIHHSADLIDSRLNIRSKYIDLAELTGAVASDDTTRKPFDEQIENFSMRLDFKSSARAFTEFKHLPEGEFFIEDMYAKLKHYPHTFHDFHADVYIDENDLRIVDFSGMLDTSDFHFVGKLHDYGFWFAEKLQGDTRIDFDLTSEHLRLEDLFVYQNENYIPEDYRHEELTGLKIHGISDLHFKGNFHSADVRLTQFDAKMKAHPLKLRNFKGRVHYEDEHVQIDTLWGQIGKSSFWVDLNYYLGDDEAVRKRDNHLGIHARKLDFDELANYTPPPATGPAEPVDHEAGFNLYQLPFTPMTFDLDIRDLNYHRYLIRDFKAKFRTERDHFIRVDTMTLRAAGGRIDMAGVFDGRNPERIYLDPRIYLTDVDLDKLLLKFENFGQDHLVSENLHGNLSGKITGHIHVHPDFVPKLDDSEIHLDIEVLNGRLDNYEPLVAMAEYFGDKNLSSVRFDSLLNHLDVKDGVLNIPNMTLNTTLGHMDFSGKQKISGDYDMEYYVRVPMKMVTQVAKNKLFPGKKKDEELLADAAVEEEEIIYKDDSKRIRYLNLKILGDLEDYSVKLGRDKKAKRAERQARRAARREARQVGM